VIHLAALVGVGQSMYEMVRYTDGNQRGTAVLMEALTQRRDQVRRLVVASSMSIYGEGLYRDADGQVVRDAARSPEQVEAHHWEPLDASGRSLEPIPSDESTPVTLASNYALGKYAQEQLTLIAGRAYDIPTVPLRFFNVYGPRQALSNPYTGVLAIFASRLLNDAPPLVFEDGQQRRDFVHVTDVARAVYLALTTPAGQVAGQCFNIGSGHSYTVEELGLRLAEVMDKPIAPRLTGEFRVGDIRHCFADIAKARDLLGYEPQVTMEQGMADLADWLQGQRADDRVESARLELAGKGLTR
jgi:dTDP-L-rhamnose 4-epimerase